MARRLRELRTSLGYSQTDVARRAHLSQADVSRAERGQLGLSEASVSRLASVLDVPAEELLTLWRYVHEPVRAAVLASDLSDDGKQLLLRQYDRLMA